MHVSGTELHTWFQRLLQSLSFVTKEGLQNTTLNHWCFLPEGLVVDGQ